MMPVIDAHAHLIPFRTPGSRDARTGTEYLSGGRVRKADGETVPLMPASYGERGFPAGALLEAMDGAGVARAVILANSLTDPADNALAVRNWPDRFLGAMTVPCSPEGPAVLRHWHDRGLRVIKFELSPGLGYTNPGWYPGFRLDCPEMEPVWALAETLGVTVTVDPGRVGGPTYQVEALEKLSQAYPRLRFVVCHLGFPDVPMTDPVRRARWKRMTDLARRDNVWFDFAALTDFCREEAPAFPTPVGLVRAFMDEYGPQKLLWGSDAPGALCAADYGRLLALYAQSPLFTEGEKHSLFWDNACRAYGEAGSAPGKTHKNPS